MPIQAVLLVDASGKVTVALVHHFLDVRSNLLVVTANVHTLGVVSVSVDVFHTVVVNTSVVSASLITIVQT